MSELSQMPYWNPEENGHDLKRYIGENQQFYDILFEYNPDAVFALDADGIVISANPACERISGWTRDELLHQPFSLLMAEMGKEQLSFTDTTLATGEPQTFESMFLNREGHRVEVQVTTAPLMIKGRFVGIYCIAKDISERKRAEAMYIQSKNSLAEAQRIAHLGSWDFDLMTNSVYWSDEMYRIFGVEDPENFVTSFESCMKFVHPEDRAYMLEEIQKSLGGNLYDIEYRIVQVNGSVRFVHAQGEVLFNAAGQAVRMIGTLQDVSDRKRVEEALRESEAKFRLMAENMTDVITVTDTEALVEYASPSHESVLGNPPGIVEGVNAFAFVHPDDHAIAAAAFADMLQSKQPRQIEMRCKSLTSEWVMVDIRGVPMLGENGEVEKVLLVGRDISERKKTEEMLLRSEKLSIAGQLAAGLAHEIRNPLTSLKGFVQLMLAGGYERKDYLDVMTSELDRIELIVSELLVLSKPQATHFKAKDMAVILQDVLTLLDAQAILSNIRIVTEFEAGLPLVTCDGNQLKQVFINFLKNAIEAMQHGGVIKIQVQREADDHVLVRFIDQGCGIPQDRISKLGEPFYTTKDKGTGLGLMVSYKIIENHAGRISIDSEVGCGTTIAVLLPIAVKQA